MDKRVRERNARLMDEAGLGLRLAREEARAVKGWLKEVRPRFSVPGFQKTIGVCLSPSPVPKSEGRGTLIVEGIAPGDPVRPKLCLTTSSTLSRGTRLPGNAMGGGFPP
jgi:hypothetical protein